MNGRGCGSDAEPEAERVNAALLADVANLGACDLGATPAGAMAGALANGSPVDPPGRTSSMTDSKRPRDASDDLGRTVRQAIDRSSSVLPQGSAESQLVADSQCISMLPTSISHDSKHVGARCSAHLGAEPRVGSSSPLGTHENLSHHHDEGSSVLPQPAAAGDACQVCGLARAAKYRCPGCGCRTCSLPCVRRHKAGPPACSGKRDRLAFVPLQAFDDRQLMSGAEPLSVVNCHATHVVCWVCFWHNKAKHGKASAGTRYVEKNQHASQS
jgi:hypothetical protein